MLIIGSLLWDSKQHRESWRRERLDLDAAHLVRAPIRYGRRSTGRGCSYTMVFSTSLNGQQLGRAMVVPCSNTAKDIASIVAEAERLWTAETSDGRNPNGRISASWGCVALMEHPERQLPDEVRYGWTRRVAEEGCGYGQLNSAVDEEPAVEQQSGFLNIPWPTPLGGSDLPCDVLLATATNPTIVGDGYPSAQQIADAWNTCTYGKPHTHGSRDRSRGRGAGERWQRAHRGRALRERRRVAGVLRTFLRPPRGVHGLPAATVHGGRQAA